MEAEGAHDSAISILDVSGKSVAASVSIKILQEILDSTI
jgi:serine phosphatase RsbU (regulator of sigma subunit)